MSYSWLKKEIVQLIKLGFPVVMTTFFQELLLLISLIFVGHIPGEVDNSLYYSAAGLGESFVNVVGFGVAEGFATAVDTLCSQAYGCKNYKRVGVILQRGVLILGLVMLPLCTVMLNAETLLLLAQQKPCIARLSGFYAQLMSIALPFYLLYEILQHYLNAQTIVWQFVVIGFLTNCISVMLHAILIYGVGMGYKGAVLALVLSMCLPPFMVIVYVRARKLHEETWGGLSWQSLYEWVPFIKLAVPGMLVYILEWSSAAIITFIAGTISKTELAATSIWFHVAVFLYMIPMGLSVATSVRVGNALGAGEPKEAKKITFVSVGIALCIALLCSVLVLATKDYIGFLFISGDVEVVERASIFMCLTAVMIPMEFVQEVIAGSLEGSGRQYISAVMVFVAYYIIGLPLGVLLALLLDIGVLGFLIGMAGGEIVHVVVFVIVIIFSKWDKLSEKAIELAQSEPEESALLEGEKSLELNELNETEKADEEKIEEPEKNGTTEVLEDSSSGSDEDEQLLSRDTSTHDQKVSKQKTASIRSCCQLCCIQIGKENSTECSKQEKGSVSSAVEPVTSRKNLKWHILGKGSLFVLGVAVLVGGGVASMFHPYVAPEKYANCSEWIGKNVCFSADCIHGV